MPNVRDLDEYAVDVIPSDLSIISRDDTDFTWKLPISGLALPNQVRFSAFLTVAQVESGTYNTIAFDTVLYDLGDQYSSNDGVFTAREDGVYLFETKLAFDTTFFSYGMINMFIGSSFSQSPPPPNPIRRHFVDRSPDNLTARRYYTFTWVTPITAGDKIVVEYTSSIGENLVVMGGVTAYDTNVSTFTGVRIG